MFEIRLLPNSELGPSGQRLGQIRIGNFVEKFACCEFEEGGSVESLRNHWREELQSLVDGATTAALRHDPRFAWILYRYGNVCFVRQCFLIDGLLNPIPSRDTHSDDGCRISEWETSLEAIIEFLSST